VAQRDPEKFPEMAICADEQDVSKIKLPGKCPGMKVNG